MLRCVVVVLALGTTGVAEAGPSKPRGTFADVIDPVLAKKQRRPPVASPLSVVIVATAPESRERIRQKLAGELRSEVMDRLVLSVVVGVLASEVVDWHGCEAIVEERPCTPHHVAPAENELTIDLRCHPSTPAALAATIKRALGPKSGRSRSPT